MNFRSKLAVALVAVGASFCFAAPTFADSTSSFSFDSTLGTLGTSATLTSGGLSLVATGYSAPGMTTDLFAKNEGPSEFGMGIASGADREITGTSFIQLNLTQVLSSNPSSVMLGIGSIQNPDTYSVWGSNTAGSLGALLASNQTAGSFNLSSFGQYDYISITSPNGGTVLIDGLTVTTPNGASTPEPGSGELLVAALAAVAGLALVVKKL